MLVLDAQSGPAVAENTGFWSAVLKPPQEPLLLVCVGGHIFCYCGFRCNTEGLVRNPPGSAHSITLSNAPGTLVIIKPLFT